MPDDEQLREAIRPIVAAIDLGEGRDAIAARVRRSRTIRAVRGGVVLVVLAGLVGAAVWNIRPRGHDRVLVATKPPSTVAPAADDLVAAARASGLPGPRDQTVMAYDARRHEVVLFGGERPRGNVGGNLADTWLFDRHGWREVHPPTSPPGRFAASMAYDARTGTTVLYGGMHHVDPDNVPGLTDTWTWDGATWHEQHPVHVPPWSDRAPLAFDHTVDALTMLAPPPGYPGSDPTEGGFDTRAIGDASRFDRWRWEGGDWLVTHDTTSPPIGFGVYVWDAPSRQMLYFDYQPPAISCPYPGCSFPDPTGTKYAQTWTFDGKQWAHRRTSFAPRGSSIAFSMPPKHSATVLAGTRMWSWRANEWAVVGRDAPETDDAVAVDDDTGVVLMLGTSDGPDMWIGTRDGWTSVTPAPAPNPLASSP